MEKIIIVERLKKEFKSFNRSESFVEALKSLVKRDYKVTKAVDDISFSISKGEIVGFLGPNGAGKSTTIKMLSGIVYADSGNIEVLGFNPWKERIKYVGNIGVIFGQKSQLFWDLPPIDAFYMNKEIYNIDKKIFDDTLEYFVRLLDLFEIMKKPTRQLSLGERMKCEFVMSMLHRPKVVFLDEPTIGLDVFAKETIRKFIKDMNKKFGTTFIVTSHDLEDIENLCDRVIIINHGKIVFDDDVSKLVVKDKKYITVKFYEKIDFDKLSKVKEIKILDRISEHSVRLEANVKKIYVDELIKKIRMGKRIEDLEISNPPITEIIKKLYKD